MTAFDLKHALEIATSAALEAGRLLRAEFHRAGGPRHEGSHHADVDDEAERVIRERLLAAFPETNYVGEETGASRTRPGAPTWYVDPNDGTKAFIKGFRGSAVSIALVIGDLPVLGVVYAPLAPDDDGDLVTWAEGEPVRRHHREVQRAPLAAGLGPLDVVLVSQDADRNSASNAEVCAPARFRHVASIAYRLALVAAGEGEAAVSLNGPVHWDFAAGHALVRGVGGDLLDGAGRPIRYGSDSTGGGSVFGGHVAVAGTLARRPWRSVFAPEAPQRDIARALPLVVPSHAAKTDDAGRLRRAQGCLLGQFSGDALGALVEFRSAASIDREYLRGVRELADGGPHRIIAGQPTDDSELALALARSLVARGDFDVGSVRAAYVAWRDSGPFDIGGTTSAGLSGHPRGDSEANGALMRVSPLAVFGAALGPDDVARRAREDAAITHPNPVCRDASAVFSVAIAHAVRSGTRPRETYDAALAWARRSGVESSVLEALEQASKARPAEFQIQQGWVLIALQNAFFELLHAASFEEGVVRTVMAGGDTDTNAAIAGALLGAVHGRETVPLRWRRAVLTCRTLSCPHPRPKTFWPVDAYELAEALLAAGERVAR